MSGQRQQDVNDYNDYEDGDIESGTGANDNGDPRNPPDPTPGALIPVPIVAPIIEKEIQK